MARGAVFEPPFPTPLSPLRRVLVGRMADASQFSVVGRMGAGQLPSSFGHSRSSTAYDTPASFGTTFGFWVIVGGGST